MERHGTAVVRGAVLENINALPGAQRHSSLLHRNGELRLGQSGADVRRHIVRPFRRVPEQAVVFGDQPVEELVQVVHHIGIGILLNGQRRRGVLQKTRQQARVRMAVPRQPLGTPAPVISYSPLPRVVDVQLMRELPAASLLDRDALGQVARLIHIAAAAHRDVIRQQLQRHDLQNRRQQIRCVRESRSRGRPSCATSSSPSVTIAITMPSRAFTS